MNAVDPKYSVAKNECIIDTMPKTRNQGGLPICYAAVSAMLLDEFQCYARNNRNCISVPDDDRPAMADLARLSKFVKDWDERANRDNYVGLKEGGSVYQTLFNTWHTSSIVPISCMSDSTHLLKGLTLATYTSNDGGTQGGLWGRLRQFHETLGGSKLTNEQAAVLKRDFQLQPSVETIETAFSEKEWSTVLDMLLVPRNCAEDWRVQWSPSTKMDRPKVWPDVDDAKSDKTPTYAETVAKIKDLLTKEKRPVAINFCAVIKPGITTIKACADASFGHTAVIEGYRQMCNQSGKCIDSLKVRNTWGDDWQAKNNNGWVDAKTLIDATFYDGNFLVWLEKRPPTQY